MKLYKTQKQAQAVLNTVKRTHPQAEIAEMAGITAFGGSSTVQFAICWPDPRKPGKTKYYR
jgi:hypothetical protein